VNPVVGCADDPPDRRWPTNSRHDASRLAIRGSQTRGTIVRSELERMGRRRRDCRLLSWLERETAQRFIRRSISAAIDSPSPYLVRKKYTLAIRRNVNYAPEKTTAITATCTAAESRLELHPRIALNLIRGGLGSSCEIGRSRLSSIEQARSNEPLRRGAAENASRRSSARQTGGGKTK